MCELDLRKFEDKHPELITIDSEVLTATTYIVEKRKLVIHAANNGILKVKKDKLQEFIDELQNILDVLPTFTERNPEIKYKKGKKITLKTVGAV